LAWHEFPLDFPIAELYAAFFKKFPAKCRPPPIFPDASPFFADGCPDFRNFAEFSAPCADFARFRARCAAFCRDFAPRRAVCAVSCRPAPPAVSRTALETPNFRDFPRKQPVQYLNKGGYLKNNQNPRCRAKAKVRKHQYLRDLSKLLKSRFFRA
jgi:hypothetical protein